MTRHQAAACALALLCAATAPRAAHAARSKYLLDYGWRFQKAPAGAAKPAPRGDCAAAWCQPATDDGAWRAVNLPHDYAVEADFSQSANGGQGYLPRESAYYRKHLTVTADISSAANVHIEFEGVQTRSVVYLNGRFLGNWSSGYTALHFNVPGSAFAVGANNVLAVFADGDFPDGWWYDGAGIYRHVWLTYVTTAGPFVAPWGVYCPSQVAGAVDWASGAPVGDAVLHPSIEVWNNATAASAFDVSLSVVSPAGAVVATATGSGNVAGGGGVTVWKPSGPVTLTRASLWHSLPKPALYTLVTAVRVGGAVVDATNVTFGVRSVEFSPDVGLILNGRQVKILGTSNHQDFSAVGTAVPDRIQWHRVGKWRDINSNGWRTAHNPPNPALLDATDELGMLVWDENHRNGQLDQVPYLIKRDRNHPSIVLWSICNEVLCQINNQNGAVTVGPANNMKAAMHALDPLETGGRLVTANAHDNIPFPQVRGSPLEVTGVDYDITQYDAYHAQNTSKPMISSETASAYGDREEFRPDRNHVSEYNQHAGYGSDAEGAWGGVGISNNQGVLTRAWMSGGFDWSGWDYRGEETPLGWPCVNSHYGAIDNAGLPKARYHTLGTIFMPPATPYGHMIPHWNDPGPGSALPIWVWANQWGGAVELFVNGASQGRKPIPQWGHVAWTGVAYAPGSLHAVVYSNTSTTPVMHLWRNTSGAPAALRISIKDGVGAPGLYAGCQDAAVVQVDVLDAAGLWNPTATNNVTFAIAGAGVGDARIDGTANGDATCHVNNKSPTRPAWHGNVVAVVLGPSSPTASGTLTITATAAGLPPVSLDIPVRPAAQVPAGTTWCRTEPRL